MMPLMLVVPDKKTLGKRLMRRVREHPKRASCLYLKHKDKIRALQAYLVGEAEEHKIPMILNIDAEEALLELWTHISEIITQHFPGKD